MDVEEIVALSVKHNVSDLHLCSDSPPRWRRSGRLEPAPFPPPDVEALLKAWLNDEQQGAWWANGQVDFAVVLNCVNLAVSGVLCYNSSGRIDFSSYHN